MVTASRSASCRASSITVSHLRGREVLNGDINHSRDDAAVDIDTPDDLVVINLSEPHPAILSHVPGLLPVIPTTTARLRNTPATLEPTASSVRSVPR